MSLPFQAVECFMANIIPNPSEYETDELWHLKGVNLAVLCRIR